MKITVTVELEHVTGLFVSRADLAEALAEEITNLGTLDVEDSEYEITDAYPQA